MGLSKLLSTSWRKFLDVLGADERRRLLDLLRRQYADQAKDVAQFEEHARLMVYPQFRERLFRIAEEEKAHVRWLGEKILALDGELPDIPPTVKRGGNAWQNLLMDVEEEQRDRIEALDHLYRVAERTDPDIAEGLRRIQEDEKRHRAEILSMLMRSDPQAFSVAPAEDLNK